MFSIACVKKNACLSLTLRRANRDPEESQSAIGIANGWRSQSLPKTFASVRIIIVAVCLVCLPTPNNNLGLMAVDRGVRAFVALIQCNQEIYL
jgi:hypothetical protein